jgi:hypothetical protein
MAFMYIFEVESFNNPRFTLNEGWQGAGEGAGIDREYSKFNTSSVLGYAPLVF